MREKLNNVSDLIITIAAFVWIELHGLISNRLLWELGIVIVLLIQAGCIFEYAFKFSEGKDGNDLKSKLLKKSFSVVVILAWLAGKLFAGMVIPYLTAMFENSLAFAAAALVVTIAIPLTLIAVLVTVLRRIKKEKAVSTENEGEADGK